MPPPRFQPARRTLLATSLSVTAAFNVKSQALAEPQIHGIDAYGLQRANVHKYIRAA